jgi:MinD-like ATPase involved in chromosome partitioning or flagellar assembly
MTGARYVLLGLAHPRSEWFRQLAQWCNGGALPAELIKCLSPEEIVHRLDSGRPASALIVDAGLPGVDRDLMTTAAQAGCAVIVVDDTRVTRDWASIGARTVISQHFDRAELLDALASHSNLIDRATQVPAEQTHSVASPFRGRVIAVVGTGGTGTSTVSIALAQGQGAHRRTVLADLNLHAEQAMLHDVNEPTGGLQSLVDAHRAGAVGQDRLAEFCLSVPTRGYDLLPGLRRARFWSAIRPVAFTAAFAALTNGFEAIVCDVDGDVEREDTGGSLDIEERTSMSRSAMLEADVVFVIGHPSMKGLHAMNRLLVELSDLGVPMGRIVPVFNQAAKSPRVRAGYTSALAELIDWRHGEHPAVTPIHLPYREVDELLRSGEAFPAALVDPLGAAVEAIIGTNASAASKKPSVFGRLRPGSLGLSRFYGSHGDEDGIDTTIDDGDEDDGFGGSERKAS